MISGRKFVSIYRVMGGGGDFSSRASLRISYTTSHYPIIGFRSVAKLVLPIDD